MAETSGSGPRPQPGAATGGLAERDPDPDHYQLLGVRYDARKVDIVRAYREAMKAVHPDRQGPERRRAAEEDAKRLNAAFAVLADPNKRQAYDRTIRATIVQDQLMGRYVGGFYPASGGEGDPYGAALRRNPTTAERREKTVADRTALITLVVVFGGVAMALVLAVLLWSLANALVGAAS